VQTSPKLISSKFNLGLREERIDTIGGVLLQPQAPRQGVRVKPVLLAHKLLHDIGEETMTGLSQVRVTAKEMRQGRRFFPRLKSQVSAPSIQGSINM